VSTTETLTERRVRVIRRIGSIWRGDWSGTMFDGRDGRRWLETALDGDDDALDALESELAAIEDSY
jgi:hypothetical protein